MTLGSGPCRATRDPVDVVPPTRSLVPQRIEEHTVQPPPPLQSPDHLVGQDAGSPAGLGQRRFLDEAPLHDEQPQLLGREQGQEQLFDLRDADRHRISRTTSHSSE